MKMLGAKSQLLRLTLQMLMQEHDVPCVLRREDGSYVGANGFTNFAKFALRLSVREADRLLLSMPDCTAVRIGTFTLRKIKSKGPGKSFDTAPSRGMRKA
jgi:hypothetical protein